MIDILIVVIGAALLILVFGLIRYVELLRNAIIELDDRTAKLEKRWIIKVVDK